MVRRLRSIKVEEDVKQALDKIRLDYELKTGQKLSYSDVIKLLILNH